MCRFLVSDFVLVHSSRVHRVSGMMEGCYVGWDDGNRKVQDEFKVYNMHF